MCNTVSLINNSENSKKQVELAIRVMIYTHGSKFVLDFMDRYVKLIKEEQQKEAF
tara:strand:+ start:148 stop:312 length:165 start_codon:yes stop_codon:yes gene_type:complete